MDNTFATPLLQNPLDLGAAVVMHSGTKYLAGHSDVLMGALVARDAELMGRIESYRSTQGAILGPMEAWLTLRGIRTLDVRLERQQRSAGVLAERLDGHPAIARVRYPGLPGDPGCARPPGRCAASAPCWRSSRPVGSRSPSGWSAPCGCGCRPPVWAGRVAARTASPDRVRAGHGAGRADPGSSSARNTWTTCGTTSAAPGRGDRRRRLTRP
ncbi:MAG: PLP-dependent transferase [Micropruina sp.]